MAAREDRYPPASPLVTSDAVTPLIGRKDPSLCCVVLILFHTSSYKGTCRRFEADGVHMSEANELYYRDKLWPLGVVMYGVDRRLRQYPIPLPIHYVYLPTYPFQLNPGDSELQNSAPMPLLFIDCLFCQKTQNSTSS